VYGTLGRMKVKPGKVDDVVGNLKNPPSGDARKGYRGAYLLVADEGGEVVVAVMYEDKDAYFAMVHDPATEANYPKLLELLEDEPTWTDGEWIAGPMD